MDANLCSREPSVLSAIADAVRAELETPTPDRARLIADAGRTLMAMAGDCVDPQRIDALLETGQLAYFDGRSVEGLAMVKAAARLAIVAGDRQLQRKALTYEAALHGDLGDIPTAVESTAGALILARELHQPEKEATLWGNLSGLFVRVGDWRKALRTAERALDLDPASPAALSNAAEACLEVGQVPKGLRYARRCVEIASELKGLQYVASRASGECIWGRLLLEVDDHDRAREHALAARAASELARTPRALVPALCIEGMCTALSDNLAAGVRTLEQARDLRAPDDAIDDGQQLALRCLLQLHRLRRDQVAARAVLQQQSTLLFPAAGEQLRTALTLEASSAIPLLVDSPNAAQVEREDIRVRFATIAASSEESTAEHGYRVSRLATLLAQDYGCDGDEQRVIAEAGRLHDIGKLCVPSSVLTKEDTLDEQELSALCEHALFGAQLLHEAGVPTEVIEAVRHHHERWDGTGFPFRLTGTATALSARIVGLAESFDEMVHATSRKREAWTVRRALEEVLRLRGKHFDPQLCDLLVERVRCLQREVGDLDEALSLDTERSTLALARRRLREMLETPIRGAGP